MDSKKSNKEIVILRHIGGRLGNQLWLYSNVYAFCLEKGYKCSNPSFYAYIKFFNIKDRSLTSTIFGFVSDLNILKSHALSYILYSLYRYLSYLMPVFQGGIVLKTMTNENINHVARLIKSYKSQRIYLVCNELNNPKGVKKYHQQITDKFSPKESITIKVDKFLKKFRNSYLVAVHIRQGDYKRFVNGRFYFSQSEVANVLRFFIERRYQGKRKVKFILFSDSKISLDNFSGLDVELGFGSNFIIEDMLAMSKCNLIIASRSSFSTYAAYYGNRPIYVFDHDKKLVPFNIYENTIFT